MNAPNTNADVFFHLNADYHVAPEATGRELLEDAHCLLNCARETVNFAAIGLMDGDSELSANPKAVASMLFGVYHTLLMAQGATEAALHRGTAAAIAGAQLGARFGDD